jgi:hypothetical protein
MQASKAIAAVSIIYRIDLLVFSHFRAIPVGAGSATDKHKRIVDPARIAPRWP